MMDKTARLNKTMQEIEYELDTLRRELQEEKNKRKKIENKLYSDIDSLNALNKELAIQNQLFEAAQRIAGFGVWEINLLTNEVYWSEKVYEMHEIPIGTKIMLKEAVNYYHPDYSKAIKRAVKEGIKKGKYWDLELILITAKKNELWVRAIGWPVVENGKTIKLGGLFHDISKQKRNEFHIRHLNEKLQEKIGDQIEKAKKIASRLKHSEARMGTIVNTAADAIIIINNKGIINFANASALNTFGYTPNEVLGKNINMLMPSPYHEEHNGYLKKYKETGVKRIMEKRREVMALRKNGEKFPIELAVSEFVEDGKLMFTGIIRDISERKQIEKTVIRQSAELQATNNELESFSYSVSHDLRTPLRSLQGFSQALLEDYESSLDEVGKNYLQRISLASIRMGNLIDDLLKLSRITQRKIQPEVINISHMATEIARELDIPNNYTISIADGIITKGDKNLIKILLSNLIGNAVKYSGKVDKPHIEINELIEDGQKWIYVKDNGVGFDMEYADKLFGAFQRLHSRNEFEGTGIGLATVQRIINSHGGAIKAHSQPNQGATFLFTLNATTES